MGTVFEVIAALFPHVLKLVEGICEDCPDKEREAMVNMETEIARIKAARKFGPRV